jgi:hypothetical protein
MTRPTLYINIFIYVSDLKSDQIFSLTQIWYKSIKPFENKDEEKFNLKEFKCAPIVMIIFRKSK